MSEAEAAQNSTLLYAVRALQTGLVKFGVTAEPMKRLRQLQVGNGETLEFVCAVPGDRKDEQALHRRLQRSKAQGEWYRPTPDVRKVLQSMLNASQSGQTWDGYQPKDQPALLHRSGDPAVSIPTRRERVNEFREQRESDLKMADALDVLDAGLAQPLDDGQIDKAGLALVRRQLELGARLPTKHQQVRFLRGLRNQIMHVLRELDPPHERHGPAVRNDL